VLKMRIEINIGGGGMRTAPKLAGGGERRPADIGPTTVEAGQPCKRLLVCD
jgi:hypothetical protein